MLHETFYEDRKNSSVQGLGWVGLCSDVAANCPLVGPGTLGGMPFVGVSLKDPSPHLREFRRKTHGKLRTTRSTKATGN